MVEAYSTIDTLKEAGIKPAEATTVQFTYADRFLQIHQGDPKKAGKALKQWMEAQR